MTPKTTNNITVRITIVAAVRRRTFVSLLIATGAHPFVWTGAYDEGLSPRIGIKKNDTAPQSERCRLPVAQASLSGLKHLDRSATATRPATVVDGHIPVVIVRDG